MSVGIQYWFRSGSSSDPLVELLADPDWHTEEDLVPFAACPGIGFPAEDYEFSVIKAFEAWGDHQVRERARSLDIEGLCILNFRRAYDDLVAPEDPMSAFWVDNVDVQPAEVTAASAERVLQMIENGRWDDLQYFVTRMVRWKLDGYYRGVSVSDAEFIEVVVNELRKVAGHCRWFAANRTQPVLVSVGHL